MEKEVKEFIKKYREKIERELGTKLEPTKLTTKEYKEFRKEFMPPHLSLYERLCNFCERIIQIKPSKAKEEFLQEAINIAHLNITPSGAISFALLIPLLVILIGALASFIIFNSFFYIFFFIFFGVAIIGSFMRIPEFLANRWRLKASNQMVLCIFYVVTYMRHTSNLELAIEFAAEHLTPPLALDLKKVIWDVETGKFESVRESLDAYIDSWKKWNPEFVESMRLVESSLFEASEDRRINALDKALDVILDGTYEKMLHFAHNLKSPLTMLHMLGIILPILGLVILPLIVNFLGGVKWYHLATIYNITLPFIVYYLSKGVLSKRPTGHGEVDITEQNPELKKQKNFTIKVGKLELGLNPLWIGGIVFIILLLVGLSPILIHMLNPEFDITIFDGKFQLLGYKKGTYKDIGPFGLGAALISLFITLSFGLGIGIYYRLSSKDIISVRERTKTLEEQFASALFQLGNRLGDGLPAEIAISDVADSVRGTIPSKFFGLVAMNIRRLGMGVRDAIFNPRYGAILYFPSNIIESSMKVLVESIKKGPVIAAQALMNVSRYIKEIHKVNERLKDLMADVISSMTTQIKFLTPVIAGIVVGITSMVTTILERLNLQMKQLGPEAVGGGLGTLTELFGEGIPTYYFQIIVGVYVVEIIYILTVLSNGIQNGSDKLSERFLLGENLIRSTMIYTIVALFVMLLFNFIASTIMGTTLNV